MSKPNSVRSSPVMTPLMHVTPSQPDSHGDEPGIHVASAEPALAGYTLASASLRPREQIKTMTMVERQRRAIDVAVVGE